MMGAFCPGWPGTKILLISAFLVTKIVDLSHHAQSKINFLKNQK
jgi:hypothetical protein